jgi:AraC-like DNA-binding protein
MADTVAAVFAKRAIDLVRGEPRLFDQVLEHAGLTPDTLEVADQRISAQSFGCIWAEVSRSIDDEFFGADSRRMKSGSFAFLCRGLHAERTLASAMDHCLRGFGLLLDDISAEMVQSEARAAIRIHSSELTANRRVFANELLVTMAYGIMCWLVGRRVPLQQVCFAFAKPHYATEYRHWLCENLVFDACFTEVWFDSEVLEVPVTATPATLSEFLQSWPQSVFVKYRNSKGWTSRVRRILKSISFAEWPDVEEVATRMHMAPSTLQRRLGSEGTSYSIVKSEMRRDLALRLLRENRMPIQDVAAEVGYQEVSAFYRAFRQWTGRAPGDYRDGLESS